TPHTALLEAAAEDLAVLNLLAHTWFVRDEEDRQFETYPNLTAFSGQRPALELPGHMVVVNTLNCASRLGQLALLNCHRVVFPLYFDQERINWTAADWCDQCHRKGGLVVWNLDGNTCFPSSLRYADVSYFAFGEALADLILGKIDAAEVQQMFVSCCDRGYEWYSFLNSGFRLPLVGS